jgi:hypothetical protein
MAVAQRVGLEPCSWQVILTGISSFTTPLPGKIHSNPVIIMGTQGIVYRDLIDKDVEPLQQQPFAEPVQTLPQDTAAREGTTTTLLGAPTESHALALEAAKSVHPAEAGAAQVPHEEEVVDLGWNEPKEHVARPLVGGLSNEDLWLLVRRFNKVRKHGRGLQQPWLIVSSKCTM